MLEIYTRSAGETLDAGEALGGLLKQGDVIAFFGELGAGKTVFAQGIARGLQVREYVTSPTFTIINEYQGDLPLYHFDVYRLEEPEEILELGHEEYFYGEGITVIEWAGKIKEYVPPGYLAVHLYRLEETDNVRRRITFEPWGKRYLQLVEELKKIVSSRN